MVSSVEVSNDWLFDNPSPFADLLDGYPLPTSDVITIGLDPVSATTTRMTIAGPDQPVRHMTATLMRKVYGSV